MQLSWLVVLIGFFLHMHCMDDQAVSLNHLEIRYSEIVQDVARDFPWDNEICIDFFARDALMLMKCANLEIHVYKIENTDDRSKMISAFGQDYTMLFDMYPNEPIVHLRNLEIYNNEHKNRGLGKQIFLYALIRMRNQYPQSVYFWKALPQDGYKKKESLFRFYKNCGGVLFKEFDKSALFYMDLAKLDLGLFKPRREMSQFLSIQSRL